MAPTTISLTDVERLAELARIELTPEEKESLTRDLASILAYVSELGSVTAPEISLLGRGESDNTVREDTGAHEPGSFSDILIAAVPRTKKSCVSVKKIITK